MIARKLEQEDPAEPGSVSSATPLIFTLPLAARE
jgi:hypothetical protein